MTRARLGAAWVTLTMCVAMCVVRPTHAESDPSSINGTNWMSTTNVRHKTLGDLTLPGTHDSATWYLSERMVPEGRGNDVPDWLDEAVRIAQDVGLPLDQLVRRWARAHTSDVARQLELGARYIDLRCAWDAETKAWRVHHALLGTEVDAVLEMVKVFVMQRPSEVVVVELSHFLGAPSRENIDRLATSVADIFGDLIVAYAGDTRTLYTNKIGDLVDANTRVMVVFADDTAGEPLGFWPSRTLTNTYANSDDERKMYAFNREVAIAFNEDTFDPVALLKLSWTLTPQAHTVAAALNVLAHNPHSLLELAEWRANPNLSKFAAEAARYHCSLGNIIVVDDIDHSDVLDIIFDLNQRGLEPKNACSWEDHDDNSFDALLEEEQDRFQYWITNAQAQATLATS